MDRDLLSHLPIIICVARHRSFAAAAAELRMSPSAVSHAVRSVEDRLGTPLFARTTRSVSVTEAARSCAVLISELPATLLRTPSKTFGGSRPYGASCDCAFVEAATALINISITSNAKLPCFPVVIDQLLSSVANSLRGFLHSQDSSNPGSNPGSAFCWLGC